MALLCSERESGGPYNYYEQSNLHPTVLFPPSYFKTVVAVPSAEGEESTSSAGSPAGTYVVSREESPRLGQHRGTCEKERKEVAVLRRQNEALRCVDALDNVCGQLFSLPICVVLVYGDSVCQNPFTLGSSVRCRYLANPRPKNKIWICVRGGCARQNTYVTCAIISILAHATQFNPLSQHSAMFVALRFCSYAHLWNISCCSEVQCRIGASQKAWRSARRFPLAAIVRSNITACAYRGQEC